MRDGFDPVFTRKERWMIGAWYGAVIIGVIIACEYLAGIYAEAPPLVMTATIKPPDSYVWSSQYPDVQFLDDTGAPVSGGRVYTYIAGGGTLLSTYSDDEHEIPNPNPVVLNPAGRARMFFKEGVPYRVRVVASTGRTILDVEDVIATRLEIRQRHKSKTQVFSF